MSPRPFSPWSSRPLSPDYGTARRLPVDPGTATRPYLGAGLRRQTARTRRGAVEVNPQDGLRGEQVGLGEERRDPVGPASLYQPLVRNRPVANSATAS